ncbi:hypothetical protein [Desulfococcus multivorans]|uniref:hypothetical protein n=1 Tax=Desulfococcus multivorans TaxID=897 RepID=UPI000411FFE7|nr:hypothetical protein [Desulfococcus multivorans]AOY60110.1 uncharacterized protein Dmul_33400 [Desulfococcus multivorans]
MPDDLVIENLQSIIASVELIETRFSEITCPEDFIMSADGNWGRAKPITWNHIKYMP